MLTSAEPRARSSAPDRLFALQYTPWVRALSKLVPGALRHSGVAVSDGEMRVRVRPGGDIAIRFDSVTRVWHPRPGDGDIPLGGLPVLVMRTDLRGTWWIRGPVDNLVVIDMEPPADGRMWGIHIRPRRLVLSLEDPDSFLAEALG